MKIATERFYEKGNNGFACFLFIKTSICGHTSLLCEMWKSLVGLESVLRSVLS